jgi:aspartate aminotransferase-like enzyme
MHFRDGPAGVATGTPADPREPAQLDRYRFKRAETDDEFEQVHRLNHAVFAVEVGQHEPDPAGRLVDKFHGKNTYYIALRRGEVGGMVAVHDRPPFSIADRLEDPGVVARLPGRPLEVRLLAVRPGVRYGAVLPGLLWQVHEHARRHGHSHLLISGVGPRVRLYQRLGFRGLGPAVAGGAAEFVPMVLDLASPPASLGRDVRRWRARRARLRRPAGRISLLPGPVQVSATVTAAFRARPVSHRDPEFVATYERTRARLGELVGGRAVGLFAGGGTLANDVVAATLAADPRAGRGLILANGEFGERLAGHARRAGLEFDSMRWPWGRPWDLDAVEGRLDRAPSIRWTWCVHLETSVGMLNDLPGLVGRLRRRGVRVCADAVSSLWAVEIDLTSIHLAAAASGKALGAYAGLGLVFAAPEACDGAAAGRVPTCLDLAAALRSRGPGSTVASPVVRALGRALDRFDSPDRRTARYVAAAALGRRLRCGLEDLGLGPIAEERWAAPVVTSFALPPGWSGAAFRDACREVGFEVATASHYLAARGWAQVATMGAVTAEHADDFLAGLARRLGRPPRSG